MILDCNGEPLRRVIGFVTRYEPVRKSLRPIGALIVFGFEVPLVEDDEESDAASEMPKRMRRTE